jgi:hypothetical protein
MTNTSTNNKFNYAAEKEDAYKESATLLSEYFASHEYKFIFDHSKREAVKENAPKFDIYVNVSHYKDKDVTQTLFVKKELARLCEYYPYANCRMGHELLIINVYLTEKAAKKAKRKENRFSTFKKVLGIC